MRTDDLTLNELKSKINERFEATYEKRVYYSRSYFVNSKGVLFKLDLLGEEEPWNCFVLDYPESGDDGDRYYPEDYSDFDSLYNDLIEEIERE